MDLNVPCLSFSQSGVTREGLDAIDEYDDIELDLQRRVDRAFASFSGPVELLSKK